MRGNGYSNKTGGFRKAVLFLLMITLLLSSSGLATFAAGEEISAVLPEAAEAQSLFESEAETAEAVEDTAALEAVEESAETAESADEAEEPAEAAEIAEEAENAEETAIPDESAEIEEDPEDPDGSFGLQGEDPVPLDTVDLKDYIQTADLEIKVGDEWVSFKDLSSANPVEKTAAVRGSISYEFPETVSVENGAVLNYQLPDGIKIATLQEGDVYDGIKQAGTYRIDTDGLITIAIDAHFFDPEGFGYIHAGSISFEGSLNAEALGTGGTRNFDFGGGVTIDVPVKEDPENTTADVTVEKTKEEHISYSAPDDSYILYTLTVTAPDTNGKTATEISVQDVFASGSEYVDSIEVISAEAGTFDTSTMTWTVPDMAPDTQYALTFKACLKSSFFSEGTAASKTIRNVASVSAAGGVSDTSEVTTAGTAELEVSKPKTEGSAVYDPATGTVSYTVIVTAKDSNLWALTDVKVVDQFTDYSDWMTGYVPGSVKIDGATPAAGVCTADDTAKTITWNLGKAEPGTSYTLTYSVYIDQTKFVTKSGWQVTADLKNEVEVFVNTESVGSAFVITNLKKVWVWKSGTLLEDGRMKYTVHANETTGDGPMFADGSLTFKDTIIGDDWVYDGDVVIKWYERGPNNKPASPLGTATVDINGKTYFEYSGNSAYYYEFEYYAKLKEDVIGQPALKNEMAVTVTATVGTGSGPKVITNLHKTDVTTQGKNYGGVKKAFIELAGETASWKSEIVFPVTVGSQYCDRNNSAASRKMTLSDEQLADIAVTFDGADIKSKCTIVKGSGDTLFTITFNEAVAATPEKPIVVTYDTTLDTSDIPKGDYFNYKNECVLTINGHTATAVANCLYVKDQKLDKKFGSYDAKAGEITWTLNVNKTGTMSGTATLIDTIPEGLKFVKAEVVEKGSQAGSAAIGTPVVDGQTVTIPVSGLTHRTNKFNSDAYDHNIKIQIVTKIVDEAFLTGTGSRTFINNAELTYGEDTFPASAQAELTKKALDKQGIYNAGTAPYVNYTITVNPDGTDMLLTQDRITLVDTMAEGMLLKSDSLKIVDGDGHLVEPENLEINGNVFSFDVPDNVKLVITYKAYVPGEIGDHKTVSNTVKFVGHGDEIPTTGLGEITITKSSASVEGKYRFYVVKKNGLHLSEKLAGAVFTLYKVNDDGSIGEQVDQKTIGSDNSVCFTELQEDTVYAYVETSAPYGFVRDSNYHYIAFRNASVTTEMQDLGVIVIQKGIPFDVYNRRGEITVSKAFSGNSGPIDGTYWFGLFDLNGQLVTLPCSQPSVISVVVHNGVQTPAKFSEVPVGSTYKVYETDSAGNKLDPDNAVINGVRFTYTVSGDGAAALSKDAPAAAVTVTNTISLRVNKVDGTKTTEVAGAVIALYAAGETAHPIATWTSKTGETVDFGPYLVAGQSYRLVETNAPTGYTYASDIEFTVNKNGTVTIDGSKVGADGTVLMADKAIALPVNKTDLTGSTEIDGAVLTLYAADEVKDAAENLIYAKDKEIVSWTSKAGETFDFGPYLVVGGSFKLVETKAPTGYIYAPDIEFTVNPDGTTSIASELLNAEGVVVIKDDTTKVTVSKVDDSTLKELGGAHLAILDPEKHIVEDWISDADSIHSVIGKLDVGVVYTLTEIEPPEGYDRASDIKFSVKEDGTVLPLVMKDVLIVPAQTMVSLIKLDGKTMMPLSGAKLAVKNWNGTIVDTWVSDGTEHVIKGKLSYGKTYTLTELEAPKGYYLADDVEFTVTERGVLLTFEMLDMPTEVAVSKRDGKTGSDLAGAELAIVDAGGVTVASWTSDGSTHTVTGVLEEGKTYTLTERSAPTGYEIASDIPFTVANGTELQLIIMNDAPTDPEKPDKPDDPAKPDTPDKPDNPDNPDHPDEPENHTPIPGHPGTPDADGDGVITDYDLIFDGDVPLGGIDWNGDGVVDEMDVLDYDVPLGGLVQTGDELGDLLRLGAVSALGLCLLLFKEREEARKRRHAAKK